MQIQIEKREEERRGGRIMATEKEVTLLGMWASPLALRIEWALIYKGISYEYVDEDLDNKSQRLVTYNPVHKQIPVLIQGGKPIAESLVILEYIDETWTQKPILPLHPYDRATARFWAKFGDEKCWATLRQFFAKSGEEQETIRKEAVEYLKKLDKLVEGKKFFSGESVGYLDIVLGWLAYWTPFTEEATGLTLVDETSMPCLKAWFQTILNVPWIKQVLPPPEKLRSHLHAFRARLLASHS